MNQRIHLGYAVLGISEIIMYQTTFDKLRPYFGEKNVQLDYMVTDSFFLGKKTIDIQKD